MTAEELKLAAVFSDSLFSSKEREAGTASVPGEIVRDGDPPQTACGGEHVDWIDWKLVLIDQLDHFYINEKTDMTHDVLLHHTLTFSP